MLRVSTQLASFFMLMSIMSIDCLKAEEASTKKTKPTSSFAVAVSEFIGRFVSPEGRVIDDYNGGVSHSEGQGYGMLVAAFADDRNTFDRIWSWTSKTLFIRGDNLAAWRWEPNSTPNIVDRNNATDGDLLIAWALLEAADRWDGYYAEDSHRIAKSIANKLVFRMGSKLLLRPAASGFGIVDHSSSQIVNLSYWVFPALMRLTSADPSGPWAQLIDSGLDLLDASRFGPAQLPSDWILLDEKVVPSAIKPARFGYDVIRVPLYLAWAFPKEEVRLRPFVTALMQGKPQVVDLETGKPIASFGGAGFLALAAVIDCTNRPINARPSDLANDSYYPSILGVLSIYVSSKQVNCGIPTIK